jgi:hypothetical protein
MMRGNMGRRRTVTLDDILVLLGRRVLLPLAISVMMIAVPFFLLIGGFHDPGGAGFGVDFFFLLIAVGAAVAAGLVFVGVPAGYIVARRRFGFLRSIVILAAIGFTAPALPVTALIAGVGGGFEGLTVGAFAGLVGMMVSVVWTVSNSDLFRTDNVA